MTRRVLLTAAALALSSLQPVAAAPPPLGGTISIEARTADGEYDPSTRAFAEAVAAALSARGFTVLDDVGHAAWIARIIVGREQVGTGLAKAPAGPASIAPGASAGAGVGVSIPLSNGKSNLVPLVRTRLELDVYARGGAGEVWHGTAVTVRSSGTREGANARVASDLSRALVGTYPAEPPGEVGVP